MPKMLLARIHVAAAAGAIAVITTFLIASGVTELTGGAGDIRALRHAILLGLPLLIACLVTAGLTGQRLAGGSGPPPCAASSDACRPPLQSGCWCWSPAP